MTKSAFTERTSKRRKGYPSETHVKRGRRVVHGDKELFEKLGRNDLCPCGSGRRFQKLLPAQQTVRRFAARPLLLGNNRVSWLCQHRHDHYLTAKMLRGSAAPMCAKSMTWRGNLILIWGYAPTVWGVAPKRFHCLPEVHRPCSTSGGKAAEKIRIFWRGATAECSPVFQSRVGRNSVFVAERRLNLARFFKAGLADKIMFSSRSDD